MSVHFIRAAVIFGVALVEDGNTGNITKAVADDCDIDSAGLRLIMAEHFIGKPADGLAMILYAHIILRIGADDPPLIIFRIKFIIV